MKLLIALSALGYAGVAALTLGIHLKGYGSSVVVIGGLIAGGLVLVSVLCLAARDLAETRH